MLKLELFKLEVESMKDENINSCVKNLPTNFRTMPVYKR